MDDHGQICQTVEMRDRGDEDGGAGGDGDELAIADGCEDGEERVGIVSDGLDL